MPPSSPFAHDSQAGSSGSLVNRHKRRGVALSCAECRRLKLKCSRQFPCSNCVKKGCAAICPQGALTTGKGNRFVLANTEALHDKINILSNRVRHLEDALSESHSINSNDLHPLLSEELLQIKRPLERERDDGTAKEEKVEGGESIDALGSLSISQSGKSTFFGTAANSWYLLQIEEGSDEEESLASQYTSQMPHDLPWLSHGFPFTSAVNKTSEAVRTSITGHLPALAAAKRIANLYFRHAAWMYTPVSETEFYSHILPEVYGTDEAYRDPVHAHTLSVFFMILAVGTLLDLDMPSHSPEAMQYFQIGRAALALDSVLEEQSITALQALLLMCHFMFLSDMAGPRWVLMGIVVKVAQSIGLHRDSGKWKLDSEETQKRRELFYEILTYDSWQSLTFGRPPSLSTIHIDCKLPHGHTGAGEMSFAAWKHSYSAECLSVVHDQAFGTRTPNYATIQELDTKVRNWYIPPNLVVPGFGNSKIGAEVEQPSIELTMERYIAFAIKEITLFYMHRGFFAQALEDNPNDPMGSKYSPSVLAAYTSAMTLVALVESLFKQHPRLTERMWFLFTHVFSSAIVLGSIAVKSRMHLAPSALSYLDLAHRLFTQVSDTARASKILPILQKLKDRAHAALSVASSSDALPHDPASRLAFFSPTIKTEETETEIEMKLELSALGGMTRLVARRGTPSSPPCSQSDPSSPSQQPASPPTSGLQSTSLSPYPQLPENTTSWQNYTHIQNLNVNINVGDYPSYPSSSSAQSHPTPTGMSSYGYNQQQHQHQHQHQQPQPSSSHSGHLQHALQHQQQGASHHQTGLPMVDGTMGEYYPYAGYQMPVMMTHQGDSAPMNDMDYPWHNLVAQYK